MLYGQAGLGLDLIGIGSVVLYGQAGLGLGLNGIDSAVLLVRQVLVLV